MHDCDEMLKFYPEIILISKSPTTWKGLLTVTNYHTKCKMKVKVKLVAPSFPRLDNAQVFFGQSIANLFSKSFKSQVDSVIKRSESVLCFFQELTKTIVRNYYYFFLHLSYCS